jgi:hypothetical protein
MEREELGVEIVTIQQEGVASIVSSSHNNRKTVFLLQAATINMSTQTYVYMYICIRNPVYGIWEKAVGSERCFTMNQLARSSHMSKSET